MERRLSSRRLGPASGAASSSAPTGTGVLPGAGRGGVEQQRGAAASLPPGSASCPSQRHSSDSPVTRIIGERNPTGRDPWFGRGHRVRLLRRMMPFAVA